jgi:selenocysteine lyase/cysteine desulfurase
MDTNASAPLGCQSDLFDIDPDILYLNAASKSVMLRASVEAGQVGAAAKGRPWTIDEETRLNEAEEIRTRFAGLIGATGEDIAIHPAASYGIATAANHLNPEAGARILVIEGQFPSNVYAWRKLAYRTGAEIYTVPWPEDGDWTSSVLAAIDERLAVAALPPCHWTDGARLDLVKIGAAVKDVGATFLVDATQWVGAVPIDVHAIKADYLVCAAYKWLLGPYGLSFMYAAPDRQYGQALEDHLYNHGGVASITAGLSYPDAFTPGARRYDAGEYLNLMSLPMILAALKQIDAWRPERIAAYLGPLTEAMTGVCVTLGLDPVPADVSSPHILGVRRKGGFPADFAARLAHHGVHTSARGGAMRLSPYLFNTTDDAERLGKAIESVLESAT